MRVDGTGSRNVLAAAATSSSVAHGRFLVVGHRRTWSRLDRRWGGEAEFEDEPAVTSGAGSCARRPEYPASPRRSRDGRPVAIDPSTTGC